MFDLLFFVLVLTFVVCFAGLAWVLFGDVLTELYQWTRNRLEWDN
jgi:hypothetical protein